MTKDSNPTSIEILKILVDSKDKLHSEIEKLDTGKREHIDNKVNNYIAKKQKNLENITGKMNEEFMNKHTFSPELQNNDPRNPEKRNLDQFLNDQNNHTKKNKRQN